MSLLIAAGILGGTGSTLGATSAAWSDGDTKKDLGVASVLSLAAGGAVLGLRTALNLNEIGRTQRIAAARNVNTAIAILEKYALSDDPKAVGDDGFGGCRDEDVNIANAFPGAGAAASIEQLISKTKETEKKASTDATAAKGAAKEAGRAAESSKKKAIELKTRVEDLKREIENPPDPKITAAQKANKVTALDQAQKDLERAETNADKQAAEATKAQIDAAKAELAAAQAELATARAVVLQAGASLRRAVFYLTTKDVEIARGALADAISDVEKKRDRGVALQKHVDDLLNNGVNQNAADAGSK